MTPATRTAHRLDDLTRDAWRIVGAKTGDRWIYTLRPFEVGVLARMRDMAGVITAQRDNGDGTSVLLAKLSTSSESRLFSGTNRSAINKFSVGGGLHQPSFNNQGAQT